MSLRFKLYVLFDRMEISHNKFMKYYYDSEKHDIIYNTHNIQMSILYKEYNAEREEILARESDV